MKLKEIEGLLVEKKQVRYCNEFNVLGVDGIIRTVKRSIKYDPKEEGFNQAIDLMGERGITLNREKLAAKLFMSMISNSRNASEQEMMEFFNKESHRDYWLGVADTILPSLPEILEVWES